jgi:hypothetical protein
MAESKANFNRHDEEERRGDRQLPEESGGTTTGYNVRKNPTTIVESQGIYSSKTLHSNTSLDSKSSHCPLIPTTKQQICNETKDSHEEARMIAEALHKSGEVDGMDIGLSHALQVSYDEKKAQAKNGSEIPKGLGTPDRKVHGSKQFKLEDCWFDDLESTISEQSTSNSLCSSEDMKNVSLMFHYYLYHYD